MKTPGKGTPSPDAVFAALNAYQATEALKAAIELDVFTAVDEGKRTAAALAERCGSAERGMRILCDFLAIGGFLTKAGGRYGLTKDAKAFLSRKSPMCVASAAKFLASDDLRANFKDLASTVRRGGAARGGGTLKPENPVWVEFARSMAPLMAPQAHLLAALLKKGGPAGKTLDIAAGHGLFGLAVAKADPSARVVGLDWPNVLAVAKENAARMGLSGRFEALPGDAFKTDFGSGYGTVLVPNFLHHFDEAANVRLLKKVRAALAPKGRVAIVEFVPNPDRVTPRPAAAFSMVMLGSTPSGDAYTHAELDRMLKAAGFGKSVLTRLGPTPQSAVLAVKK